MPTYSVYIITNWHRTVLYTGLTSNLRRRIGQHKCGQGSRFAAFYNCHYLLYYEEYTNVHNAIAREKGLKRWKRAWKLELIRRQNPGLIDLAADWYT